MATSLSTHPPHHSELCYPLSVIPGMADPTSPKVYFRNVRIGEEVSMRLVYKGLEKILKNFLISSLSRFAGI